MIHDDDFTEDDLRRSYDAIAGLHPFRDEEGEPILLGTPEYPTAEQLAEAEGWKP